MLVFLEVLIPPIPSEVILPFAGYLSQSGELNLGWLIFWSTLASWLGALLLYGLGAAIGMQRAVRLLAATRLVSRSDLERGADWFTRSGGWTVLVGRMVPGVRSLISIPAGASRMNLATFSIYTIVGSGAWNALLLGVGAALGTQHEQLEQYLGYLDYAVYTAIVIALIVWSLAGCVRLRESGGRLPTARTEKRSAPAGTRTQTEAILSRLPLPLGYGGRVVSLSPCGGCDPVPQGVIRSTRRP